MSDEERKDPNEVISLRCASCAVTFGITRDLMELRKSDYGTFSCPNGHGNAYQEKPVPRDVELEQHKFNAIAEAERRREVERERDELAAKLKKLELPPPPPRFQRLRKIL